MDNMTKNCNWCKKEFTPTKTGQLYCCLECRRAKGRENERQSKEFERMKRKGKFKNKSLRNIALEAKNAGMSYGQYVAKMEMQKG